VIKFSFKVKSTDEFQKKNNFVKIVVLIGTAICQAVTAAQSV
jgi:hypothetical protein